MIVTAVAVVFVYVSVIFALEAVVLAAPGATAPAFEEATVYVYVSPSNKAFTKLSSE